MGRSLILLLFFCCLANTTRAQQSDPLTTLGLQPTPIGRNAAQAAIEHANAILAGHSHFLLFGSWETAPVTVNPADIVRVYMVAKIKNGNDFGITVPYDCGCILLQSQVVSDQIRVYSAQNSRMMKVDGNYVLCFMLLHEIGHIDHGDFGNYVANQPKHSYNLNHTTQKDIELGADRFAATTISTALDDKGNVLGWLSALDTQLALTDVSWNLAEIRIIDYLGATTLCSKFVFEDDGYTHPNFELRILTANNFLQHTPESATLLESFEACRKEPAATP
jgi:hypothetical protein